MTDKIQHIFKSMTQRGNLLYAWFPSLHTRADLILCGEQTEDELKDIVEEIARMLASLEQKANCYNPHSELARLNATAHLAPQTVSTELWPLLRFSLEANRRTGGLFDVTVHSESHCADTIHHIHLSEQERTLYFEQQGIHINLSGLLKGYALDCIRSLLLRRQVAHALVNLGNSSVMALGHHPNGNGWKVSFADGRREENEVVLYDECLTTSGNDSESRRHIIHPLTGRLIEGKKEMAVVTSGGAEGEVLSTALFAAQVGCEREQLLAAFQPRIIKEII